MSQSDSTKPPFIHPKTLRQWLTYREESQKEWKDNHETIEDRVTSPDPTIGSVRGEYLPADLFFKTRGFQEFRKREPAISWKTEHIPCDHGHSEVKVWRFTEDNLKVVVTKKHLDLDNWDTYGEFTDKSIKTCSMGHTWGTLFFLDPVLRNRFVKVLQEALNLPDHIFSPGGFEDCWNTLRVNGRKGLTTRFPPELHKRPLKGPDSRHAWRVGLYDTFQGNEQHPARYRKCRYIQLADYDYDDVRSWYWLQGYSKREADEMARANYRWLVAYMKKIAEGEVYDLFLQAKCYLASDEDEWREIGEDSICITTDGTETLYIDTSAREVAHGAIRAARDRLSQTNPSLPGIQ